MNPKHESAADHTLIAQLKAAGAGTALVADMQRFLDLLDQSAALPPEEPVPAEMMQVFSDAQWPQLLFELQPGARLLCSRFDLVSLHRLWSRGEQSDIAPAGEPGYWIISSDQHGRRVKRLNPTEYRGLRLAQSGADFAAMAAALWPQLDQQAAHHQMTAVLLGWLADGLVIDAGVPLPEDAEFESAEDGGR